jgi:hypothetical protein
MRRDLGKRAAKAAGDRDVKWFDSTTDTEARCLNKVAAADYSETERVVRARIDQRRRLGLPHEDCTVPRRRGAWLRSRWVRTMDAEGRIRILTAPRCTCLTSALTELGGSATKDAILALSTKRHREWSKAYPRPRKPKPPPAVTHEIPAEAAHFSQEPSPQPPDTERPPKPETKRRRKLREPADPRSWSAFKRGRDGPPSAGDLMHYEF